MKIAKILAATAALTAAAIPEATAGTTVDLQGKAFNVDTVKHVYIGPGVTHSHLRFTANGRYFNAFVIDMDRTAPGAERVRPKVELGNDSARVAESLTSMAKRKTCADAQYLAGINGDFFITSSFAAQLPWGNRVLGYPNMSCAVDGKLVAPDIIDVGSRENALIIGNTAADMWIDATRLRYRVLDTAGEKIIDADAVNFPCGSHNMMIYNRANGKYTRTEDPTGRELVLELEKGSWEINTSATFKVVKGWRQGCNSAIPENGVVLSCGPDFSDKNSEWLFGLKEGDLLKVKITCTLEAFDNLKPKIKEICGGDVRILKENVTTTEAIRWINTPSALYSRSMVGYSHDRNHVVMCAVDAGAGSSGVSYYEGADVMRFLGCWDALDLDGGGSTAMWSEQLGFLNRLRDGSERAIANGIFVRLDAPDDKTVSSIRFVDWAVRLPKYGLYKPMFYGYNQYGRLVDTDVKGVSLQADAALGTVTADGTALLASGEGTHALTAVLGDMTCTLPVTVDNSVVASPRVGKVLLDGTKDWKIELQAPLGDSMMDVAPDAYAWTSSDPAVATVAADGTVHPVADGTATLTGALGDSNIALTVTVEKPKAHIQTILTDDFDASAWKLSQTNVTGAKITGNSTAFDLDFKVKSTRGPSLTAARDIVLWSRPDAVELSFTPNADIKTVTVNVQPANAGRAIAVKFNGPFKANVATDLKVEQADLADVDMTAIDAYPLTFKSVKFEFSTTSASNIKVTRLDAVYNAISDGVDGIVADNIAGNSRLTVTVGADGSVSIPFTADRLTLTDLAGRIVATAAGAGTIAAPTHGMYIVTATSGAHTAVAKVMIR